MKTFVFIACSASKQSSPCRAAELYTGDLFKLSRRWAELCLGGIDGWYILSAKYVLLTPGEGVGPYDTSLNSAEERRVFASRLSELLELNFSPSKVGDDVRFIVLAGKNYRESFDSIDWATVVVPLEGLGIGYQKSALGKMIEILGDLKHKWPYVPLKDRVEASLALYKKPGDQLDDEGGRRI